LLNITGGSNLSLYEVNEAADIVASAADEDVNMIFGAVINDNLKDEIIVTVIATGFEEAAQKGFEKRPIHTISSRPQVAAAKEEEKVEVRPFQQFNSNNLDIPTFLRNRRNRNNKK
jgi:cell division protein FtsZ